MNTFSSSGGNYHDLADFRQGRFTPGRETIEEREDTFADPSDLIRDLPDPSKDPDFALSSNARNMVLGANSPMMPSPGNAP
jgi:hypothetical protein